ncbi:MAG: amidohydrolase family protein [Acidimicrobiaceae bacterium]|nr:amidohydrolase family protein [Acidimicrobiaceae bacterium]
MQATTETQGSPVADLGYRLFDADNHYYEAEDAFLRHMDPRLVHRAPRWVEMVDGGGKRLVFGDRMNRYLGADQTFSHVGRAGGLSQGQASVVRQRREDLEPIRPEARQRDARLALMDQQGLESTMLFPTLAVSVEPLVIDDVELTYANLHAFNLWLDDDWGLNYQDRIYGVPLLSLLDPFLAVDELEFVVSRGARVVHLRPGPVAGHSPADRLFDRFWSAVADADVAVVFHASDDSYRYDLGKVWGWGNVNVPARHIPPLHRIIAGHGRPIHDTIVSLLYGKLFERFPTLRVGTIELGCAWVPELLRNLEQAGQGDLAEHPIDVFRKHVWVAPFEDEDIAGLARDIGTERILFGSDYPHTDGLAEPASYRDALTGFDAEAVRRIMHDNARELVRPTKQ